MNLKDIQKKVNELFKAKGIELSVQEDVKLMAEANLADGTKVATPADEFAPGEELFIVVEGEDPTPAPDGRHELEDGRVIVTEGGVITAIEEASEDEGENLQEEKTFTKENLKTLADEINQTYKEAIDNLNAQNAELASKLESKDDDIQELKTEIEKLKSAKPKSVTKLSKEKKTVKPPANATTKDRAKFYFK